jgi:hypothetical protein
VHNSRINPSYLDEASMRRRPLPLGMCWRFLLAVLFVASPLIGCSCSQVQEIKPTAEVDLLQKLQSAYDLAYNQVGRPLKDFSELKPFLDGIDDPEKQLVSPNDGLPYVIVYGVDRQDFSKGVPVYAYEQKGRNGVRRVITAMSIESMDEATFQKNVAAATGAK